MAPIEDAPSSHKAPRAFAQPRVYRRNIHVRRDFIESEVLTGVGPTCKLGREYGGMEGEMEEGLLEGMLGEPENEEAADIEAVAGAEGFAASLAVLATHQDPAVVRKTEEFLSEQAEFLRVQRKNLQTDHPLRIRHLRNQLEEDSLRRLGLSLRVGFQLFLAAGAAILGVGVVVFIHDAVTSRKVIVEAFHAPSGLAPSGIDGVVVAAGLLDQLRLLQDATFSHDEKLDLSNAWASDVKLEVPETGLSVGELSHLIKRRFGHDVRIEGDLVLTSTAGIALTVRGDGVSPRTFTGQSIADLDTVTRQAAEYTYAKSQPRQWANYLSSEGRDADAIAFAKSVYSTVGINDRPWLLNTWGISLMAVGGSKQEALDLFRAAVRIKPDFWVGFTNIMNSYMTLGQEELAWSAGRDMLRIAGGRPGRAAEHYYSNLDYLVWNLPAWLAATSANADANNGIGTNVNPAGPTLADIDVRMHDLAGADLALKTSHSESADVVTTAMTHFVLGRLAQLRGDVAVGVEELEKFGELFAMPAVSENFPGYQCWIALAEEDAGRPQKAAAILAAGESYVDCRRFHGDILDNRGDWAGAQRAYAEAVALAPDLPAAYYSWGAALVRHKDLDKALAKFIDANARGPQWADPLKGWADVLAAQGHFSEARRKYTDARKLAPNWGAIAEAMAKLPNS